MAVCPRQVSHAADCYLQIQGTCLAALERVRQTGEPILVTRFAQPVARIEPPTQSPKRNKFGSMAGTMTIHADIVGPITDISDWEAAQDPEDREENKG